MSNLVKSLGAFVVAFGGALIGMYLQSVAPAQVVMEAKGAVGSVVGLVTLLLALVLGLLISVSYGVYANQIASAMEQDAAIHQLDFALTQYGPEAVELRRWLKRQVTDARRRFFGSGSVSFTFAEMREGSLVLDTLVAALASETDRARQLTGTIKSVGEQFLRTQMAMARQLRNPVPSFLMTIVLGWSGLLFFGYGLLAAANALSVGAVGFGAAAVASAMFLIFEFSQPFGGLIRISREGIDTAIAGLIPD